MENYFLEQRSDESEPSYTLEDVSEDAEQLCSTNLDKCDPELMAQAIKQAKVKALNRARHSYIRYPEYLDVAMSTMIEAIMKNKNQYALEKQLAFISKRIDWRFIDMESKKKRHRKANERIALEKNCEQPDRISFVRFVEFEDAPGEKEKRKIIRGWMLKILKFDEKKVVNILMHVNGHSDDEIAREIGKKKITSKVARHRAMKVLISQRDELKQLLMSEGF